MFGLFSKGNINLVKELFHQFNTIIEQKVEPLEKEKCEYFLFCSTLYNGLKNMGNGHPSKIKIKLLKASIESELNSNNNLTVRYALTLLLLYLKIHSEIPKGNEASKCLDIIRRYAINGKFYRNITEEDKNNFVDFTDKSLYDYMIEVDNEYEKLSKRDLDLEFKEKQAIIALWDYRKKIPSYFIIFSAFKKLPLIESLNNGFSI